MVVTESRRRLERRYGFAEEEPPGVADPKTVCRVGSAAFGALQPRDIAEWKQSRILLL